MNKEMNGKQFDEGKYYTLGELVMFTGLTDRTLRNYLTSGLLQGEKIDGIWQFTCEQVGQFLSHPTVRPSIEAKRNTVVYDFLIGGEETMEHSCIIMDLPSKDKECASEYFCNQINNGDFQNLKFSLNVPKNKPLRIILKGKTAQILSLINGYYQFVSKE